MEISKSLAGPGIGHREIRMNADRWQKVKAIFHRAVEYEPAARAQFLRETCGSDQELRSEVESLLASEREPGTLLDHPVMGSGAFAAAAPARGVDLRGDAMIGRVIGNYSITGELARGGMGIVYRARHVTLPRDVVVKCIRPLAFSEAARTDLRVRFRREAHIQSQLDHPHIVRVYEFFAGAEEYFLVMEYVPGSSLRSVLDKERVLPAEQTSALAVQALDGLAHAHGLHYVDESGNTGVGIIHRDIKPGNLLVDEQGNLKLTDFGIVKVLGEGQSTMTAPSFGTVDYMSPEQIRSHPVDARSDLYSLGVTLYEMLTGRVPFPRSVTPSDYDILKAHIETDPSPIRTLNPEIPSVLADVVTRSLKRDLDQRWQTAAEFREALIAAQQTRPVTVAAATLPPDTTRRRSAPWRRGAIAGLAALLVAAAVTGRVFWLPRSGKSVSPAQMEASIAVLPFVNLSPESNQEYFSDGLADELTNKLAKTPGLRVTGRTSSFQFKGKTGDYSVIGKKLRVRTILEGSVRKQGNQARVNVQLIKAADGFPLWSESYDRDMSDIFAMQDDIARAVTGALKIKLLGEKAAAPSARSTNGDAYNAYLLGQYFLQSNKMENLGKAVGYFEQAVKLDPGYAKAWVGLAEARSGQAGADADSNAGSYRGAKEAAARALALDADLGEAHAAMAWVQQFADWDWNGADASYKRALALEPGNAIVISHAGILARILGHLDEATALGRRAMQIDPLHPGTQYNAGITLYYAGLYEEAIAAFRKALELVPEMALPHGFIGRVNLAQTRPREALAEAESEKYPALRLFGLALAYHALGRKQESDANLAALIAKFQSPSYLMAEVYAFRGETDRAFQSLDRAYTEHDTGLAQLEGDPLLKSLAHDPRYTALLKKMRLPL
jgi:serine/threonine protein kinase/tetratricopeptide (TPR) repeat protein